MATNPTTTSLADGQLPDSKASLYTSSGVKTIIKGMFFTNTSASTVTVNVYFKASGGTSRRITPVNMEIPAYSMLEYGTDDPPITLEASDAIEGDASVATTVDYSLFGAVES